MKGEKKEKRFEIYDIYISYIAKVNGGGDMAAIWRPRRK